MTRVHRRVSGFAMPIPPIYGSIDGLCNPTKSFSPKIVSLHTPLNAHSNDHSESALRATFRTAMFGFFDGLCTNANMVIGVCVADWLDSTTDMTRTRHEVMLAGMAGLLAGASSMGCSELVSTMYEVDMEREEIRRESEHHRVIPDRESSDLLALLLSFGLSETTSAIVVSDVGQMSHYDRVRFHARVELGIDQAHTSRSTLAIRTAVMWVSFATGAMFPLVPWLCTMGTSAPVSSLLPFTMLSVVFASVIVSAALAHMLRWPLTSPLCVRMTVRQLVMIVVSVSLTTLLNMVVLGQL